LTAGVAFDEGRFSSREEVRMTTGMTFQGFAPFMVRRTFHAVDLGHLEIENTTAGYPGRTFLEGAAAIEVVERLAAVASDDDFVAQAVFVVAGEGRAGGVRCR